LPDLTVDFNSRLDAFLLRNKVLPWRVPILAANSGVLVFRGKANKSVTITDGATPLQTGDLVRIVDPIPTLCAQALQKEADNNWRDYAIVPGANPPPHSAVTATRFDLLMQDFMKLRTRTIVIQDQNLSALDDFINGLATCKDILFPIRYLIVVGHASYAGSFHIRITGLPHAQSSVVYEDLEYALAHKLMFVDLSLMMPRPTGQGNPQMRLLGCAVGAQAPYMKKFKEALGNKITLIAPTHLLFPDAMISPPGPLAYMGYDFSVSNPTPVKDQATLINLLVAKSKQPHVRIENQFFLENGKLVTAAQLKGWLPKNPNASVYSRRGKPLGTKPVSSPNRVKMPVFGTGGSAMSHFIFNDQEVVFDAPFTVPLPAKTPQSDWTKVVKAWLQKTDPRFSDIHPLPFYVRRGYESMDDFMDGWDWQFKEDTTKGVLNCDPIRYEYRLWQPIATVATNELIMNYYPKDLKKVPKKFRSMMPIEELLVTDTRFFRIY
jgi:hypothetical protein